MENKELNLRIVRCLEIIDRMNKAIDFQYTFDTNDIDYMTIEQFVEIKERITKELQILLNQSFELNRLPLKVAM